MVISIEALPELAKHNAMKEVSKPLTKSELLSQIRTKLDGTSTGFNSDYLASTPTAVNYHRERADQAMKLLESGAIFKINNIGYLNYAKNYCGQLIEQYQALLAAE